MPELPDVERAAALIRSIATGKTISRVETSEDTIVYAGVDHTEFAQELTGRKVLNAGRYGKVFYLELDGVGKMPVLHFGMTGMLQVKGDIATHYGDKPKKASTDWPPRFLKFILHFTDENNPESEPVQLAFMDARRLARIRLCTSPLTEEPISKLGFDPILSMPTLEDFTPLVQKRSCPIKALLLDQSFSAGVGNWVADEVLYHARIHPEQRCNSLTLEEISSLYKQIVNVCQTACEVNADDTKFPENWLFKHRWGKGKGKQHTLKLPSGGPATIKWITVGGRTSAFVAELQKSSGSIKAVKAVKAPKAVKNRDEGLDESDLSDLSESDSESKDTGSKRKAPKTKVAPRAKRVKAVTAVVTERRSTRVKKVK